jgi:hypothetical protein
MSIFFGMTKVARAERIRSKDAMQMDLSSAVPASFQCCILAEVTRHLPSLPIGGRTLHPCTVGFMDNENFIKLIAQNPNPMSASNTSANKHSLACLLILVTTLFASFAVQGQDSVIPSINLTDQSFYQPAQRPTRVKSPYSFWGINPNYETKGEYRYNYGERNFSNKDFNAACLPTKRDLSQFNMVHIIFTPPVYLKSRSSDQNFRSSHRSVYSTAEFDDNEFYDVGPDAISEYPRMNDLYKKQIEKVVLEKGAQKIDVSELLSPALAATEALGQDLIVNFYLQDFSIFYKKSDYTTWPDFIIFKADVRSVTGEKLKTYSQIFFFVCEGTASAKYNKEMMVAFCAPALNCLLNQILNDDEVLSRLRSIATSQTQLDVDPVNFNLLQVRLMNSLLDKEHKVSRLKDLGYHVENMDFSPSKGTYVYNKSLSGNENAVLAEGAMLAGGLIDAIQNARAIKITNRVGGQLISGLMSKLSEDEQYVNSLDMKLFNDQSILFLPRIESLDTKVKELADNFQRSMADATKKSKAFTNSVLTSDMASFTKAVTGLTTNTSNQDPNNGDQNLKGPAGNQSPSTQANGNSPEAIACAKNAEQEWMKTCEYHNYGAYQNVVEFQQRYAILAKKKLLEITLKNCSQYFPENERAGLPQVISGLESQFQSLGGYAGLRGCD